jgi:hypothetical protein
MEVKLEYPEAFVKKVIEFSPANEEGIRILVEKGSELLGDHLQAAAHFRANAHDIVGAFKSKKRQQELLQKAKRAVRAKELFREWKELYLSQTGRPSRLVG